ncbi:MAG: HEAT repeat domain-containing protein [Chloroflexi bacterium]|nr:HEAT repeat domain-containing protein [Chloroflexota bacterium]
MPPRQTDEEQADFVSALRSVADQGPIPQAELDALSVLEGGDLQRFREVFDALPADARARLVRGLYGAAQQRIRLDYAAVNRLALDDADAKVRLAGVQAAIEDRSPALFERLLMLVKSDASTDVRQAAAEDLARFTLLAELDDLDPESTSRLRTTLFEVLADETQAPRVRTSALAALGYFSDTLVAEQLASGFVDATLRIGAVRGMGRTADPRWTDRLMPVLGSDDPSLREEAARALGEIEDERAVTPLVELVDDPVLEVRLAVIQALGHIGGDDAREALLYLAEAADDDVRGAAEAALEELEAAEGDPLDLG